MTVELINKQQIADLAGKSYYCISHMMLRHENFPKLHSLKKTGKGNGKEKLFIKSEIELFLNNLKTIKKDSIGRNLKVKTIENFKIDQFNRKAIEFLKTKMVNRFKVSGQKIDKPFKKYKHINGDYL